VNSVSDIELRILCPKLKSRKHAAGFVIQSESSDIRKNDFSIKFNSNQLSELICHRKLSWLFIKFFSIYIVFLITYTSFYTVQ